MLGPRFRYLEPLRELQGRTIEVVNVAENVKEDSIADLVAIVSSWSVRLHRQHRAKGKTERMIQALQGEGKHETR